MKMKGKKDYSLGRTKEKYIINNRKMKDNINVKERKVKL